MPVYVDEINDYSYKSHIGSKALRYGHRWCHMYTADPFDEAQIEELHKVAKAIGLPKNCFQKRDGFPHYDLTPRIRELALENGALDDSNHKVMREGIRKKQERFRKQLDELANKYGVE